MTYFYNILLCCTGVDLLLVWIYCCAGKIRIWAHLPSFAEREMFSLVALVTCYGASVNQNLASAFHTADMVLTCSDGAMILPVACKDGRLHPPRRAAKGAWYSLPQLAKPNGC